MLGLGFGVLLLVIGFFVWPLLNPRKAGYFLGYFLHLFGLLETPKRPLSSHPMPQRQALGHQAQQPPDGDPDEEAIYAKVMNELETGRTRSGIWAKAFAGADGDEKRAKAAYIRLRVEQEYASGRRVPPVPSAMPSASPSGGSAISQGGESPHRVTSSRGSAQYVDPKTNPLYGVKNWLALLVFSLLVAGPLWALVDIFNEWSVVDQYPHLQDLAILETLILIGLSVFSIVAGYRLNTIAPGAVKTAKAYFMTLLIYGIASPFIYESVLGLRGMGEEGIRQIIRVCGTFGIWFTYLSVSKRVKATYAP